MSLSGWRGVTGTDCVNELIQKCPSLQQVFVCGCFNLKGTKNAIDLSMLLTYCLDLCYLKRFEICVNEVEDYLLSKDIQLQTNNIGVCKKAKISIHSTFFMLLLFNL